MRSKLIPACAAVASLAFAGTALAGSGGLAPVSPASPNAEAISESYWFVSFFALAIFLLVEGLLIFFLVRYRRGRRARTADGAQIHGSTRLEVVWTIG
ncbi:MAG: cytochrome c oxidase subunit II transmembrane domain-containing protein, partial [Gaiella sp.]